ATRQSQSVVRSVLALPASAVVTSLIVSFYLDDTATTATYTLSLHDALPISTHKCMPPSKPSPQTSSGTATTSGRRTACLTESARSEERRVGKEWRAQGGTKRRAERTASEWAERG